MFSVLCSLQLLFYLIVPTNTQTTEINTNSLAGPTSASAGLETTTIAVNAPESIEILQIYVPADKGNAVKLIWGHNTDRKLNFTFGLHYGIEQTDLEFAKNTTTELDALIEDLDYCTKYLFAVSAGGDSKINTNNIRSVVTEINGAQQPQEFGLEFEPGQEPCLLVKWSASCANTQRPIGYVIQLHDHTENRTMNISLPPSRRADYIYPLKVPYGRKFEVNVSTNQPEAESTEIVTFSVPHFLQPYKVRVTSNPDGSFLIYWAEPYVPYHVGRYYYEVYVYIGPQLGADYEKLYVTKPAIIYKGEEPVYTFLIGLVSQDQQHRSLMTNPVVVASNGDTTELSIGFS